MKNIDLINFYNLVVSKNILHNEELYKPEFNWFMLCNYDALVPIVERFRKLEFYPEYIKYLTEQELLLRRFKSNQDEPKFRDDLDKINSKYSEVINKQNTRDKKYQRLLEAEADPEIVNRLVKVKLKFLPKLTLTEFSIIKPLIKE